MHSLDDLENMIQDGKRCETEGKYLLAYQIYNYIERVIDADDDSFPYAGIDPAPYDHKQHYASFCRRKVWYKLTEEEKKVANDEVNPYTIMRERSLNK